MDEIDKQLQRCLKRYARSLEPPEALREQLLALAASTGGSQPVPGGGFDWPAQKTGPTPAWLCLTRLHSLGLKGIG